MQWSRNGRKADLARVGLVELTQAEYFRALGKQNNLAKRSRMKQIAYSVMYGDSLEATIWMPEYLLN